MDRRQPYVGAVVIVGPDRIPTVVCRVAGSFISGYGMLYDAYPDDPPTVERRAFSDVPPIDWSWPEVTPELTPQPQPHDPASYVEGRSRDWRAGYAKGREEGWALGRQSMLAEIAQKDPEDPTRPGWQNGYRKGYQSAWQEAWREAANSLDPLVSVPLGEFLHALRQLRDKWRAHAEKGPRDG